MSPASMCLASSATVFSVAAPAGTITQAARGRLSLRTNSASEAEPVAFFWTYFCTLAGLRSKTTH